MRLRRTIFCAIVGAISLAVPGSAPAQVSATDVKAAFLPRFARYVTWPAAARPEHSDPFTLCVIGSDPFGAALDTAARAQTVDGRRIIVRHLDSAAGTGECQIAYVSGDRGASVGNILSALRGQSTLTVTDSRNGRQTGMIHFAVVNGRVRFSIDKAAAERQGLTISSRLLALAVSVKQ